ncbi:MAG: tetratricopeptide repeat protein [Oscillospiraceae bacterium]|nr:tetratricopeptide repeat protein [Oscillospiraceae bacterium]
MVDRFRRLIRQLLAAALLSSPPAVLIDAVGLMLFSSHGLPARVREGREASFLFALFLLVYAVCFAVVCFILRRQLVHAFSRIDGELVGKSFGGFGKRDRLFCRAMQECAAGEVRQALDHFLAVQDFEMSREETGVLAFYIGRCYQLLKTPANAAYHFRRAQENGFSKPHAMLFEARSCEQSGDYDRAFDIYQELLDAELPFDFDHIYADVGFLYIRQNAPREAAKWFRRSLEKGVCVPYALSGMSIAALLAGQFPQAQALRMRALLSGVEAPDDYKAVYDRTLAECKAQHPDWNWTLPQTAPPDADLTVPDLPDTPEPEMPDTPSVEAPQEELPLPQDAEDGTASADGEARFEAVPEDKEPDSD